MPTYGSLFSGVGGFDMGFDRAGFQCAFQCEIDKQARSVLARHWPNVTQHEDVRQIGKHNLPPIDVLIGGFPCQDLSVAGQRKGLQGGTRSGLFYELARIAVELRPRFVVFENVPGLLSSDDGRDFARVLRHLGNIGFHGGWRVLDAQHFGLAQRRRRVFGVFSRGRAGAERCAEVLALREGVRGHSAAGGKAGEGLTRRFAHRLRASGVGTARTGNTRGQDNVVAHCVTGHMAKDGDPTTDNYVTHTLRAEGFDASEDGTGRGTPLTTYAIQERAVSENLDNGPGGKGYQPDIAYTLEARHHVQASASALGVRRLTPRECERLMGWPDDWTRYAADGREIADGPRYRMAGNGVVAPVSEWIARRMSHV